MVIEGVFIGITIVYKYLCNIYLALSGRSCYKEVFFGKNRICVNVCT